MFKNKSGKDSFVFSSGFMLSLIGAAISFTSLFSFFFEVFIFGKKDYLFVYLIVYTILGTSIFSSGHLLCKIVRDTESFLKNKIDSNPDNKTECERLKSFSEKFMILSVILLFVLADYVVVISDFTFPIMILACFSIIFSFLVVSHYKKQIGFVEDK